MSIVFPDSHVDLMSSVPMVSAQVAQRWDRELLRKWSQKTQDNLRDFMQIKNALDPETFPNYAENEVLLAAFIADKSLCYERRVADEAKAEQLGEALAYEAAVREVARLTLMISGREAVEEVPEELDPETGEVLVPWSPAVESLEPLSETILVDDVEAPNPVYVAAVEDLATAQGIVDSADAGLLELVAQRSS